MITLHPYQAKAAKDVEAILRAHRIAYLVGEPRVGKTLTAMEVVRSLGIKTALVVTKKKAISSIEKDRDSYGLKDVVTVTNFEQLPKFAGKSFGLLICDESHGVSSYPKPSKRFKDLQQIHRSGVLLMSGTPSPESYSQLFFQFRLGSAPWGMYKSFYQWAAEFVNVRQKYVGTGQKVNDYSDAYKDKVLGAVRHLMVTVSQQDAGFTTEIEEHIHLVEMKPRTYRLATRIMRDGVIGTPKGRAVVADTGAKKLSKLQQVYGGAVITERHGPVTFDRSKAEYIKKTFGHTRHAILYKYNAEGDILKQAYGDAATDSPELFNADPAKVFIGQVQASREGVNLSSADNLIFCGIDYAALSYLQGRERASYRGRESASHIHWIFAKGGMEPKVYDTVRSKDDFTLSHFKRYVREHISAEADQGVRGAGVSRHQIDPSEQGRVSRLTLFDA